jgi:hypothetical protein
MASNIRYAAFGIEANRGTAEKTTVGFLPLTNGQWPQYEPVDERKNEYRGEQTALGAIGMRRMSRKWTYPCEFNAFTESGGGDAGIVGSIIKHCLGFGSSTQNGSTGQYDHMIYPVHDPENVASGYLGTTAITANQNTSEGDTVKNKPWIGGIVSGLTFSQEVGQLLKISAQMMGQTVGDSETLISTPTFPLEALRLDYSFLTCYTGTITRTGTGPDFTDFAFGSATQFCPDSFTLTIEAGKTDNQKLCGVDYPTKVRLGQYKITLSITTDWEDPASGFSSVDDYNLWLANISQTNFFFHYDTGTQAGTGDNHQLFIDIPVLQRIQSAGPDITLENDPMKTLEYEGDFDAATTAYIIGIMLKNTASSI